MKAAEWIALIDGEQNKKYARAACLEAADEKIVAPCRACMPPHGKWNKPPRIYGSGKVEQVKNIDELINLAQLHKVIRIEFERDTNKVSVFITTSGNPKYHGYFASFIEAADKAKEYLKSLPIKGE